MKNFKLIARFFIIFSITYTFFLLPQTGIDRRYEKVFRSIGNRLYNGPSKEEVIFLKEDQAKEYDTQLYLSNKTLKQGNNDYKGTIFPMKTRRIGYIATAFLVALIVATPLTWKRKIFALVIGIFLMLTFAMVKLRIIILHHYTISEWVGLHQDPAEIKKIEYWNDTFARSNTNSYYFVIIVWLALCFGKKEWQKLNGSLVNITSKTSSKPQTEKPVISSSKQNIKKKKK